VHNAMLYVRALEDDVKVGHDSAVGPVWVSAACATSLTDGGVAAMPVAVPVLVVVAPVCRPGT
jgi:hypothetical protein